MNNYFIWFDSIDVPILLPIHLNFEMGEGMAELNDNYAPSFAEMLTKLDQLIIKKEITARDLKCRFDGCYFKVDHNKVVLNIRIAPTHYYACRHDIDHAQLTAFKIQKGLEIHQDIKYYLSCGMGVVVLPYTKDGRVLLGLRQGIDYDKWWHGIAGWLPFERNLSNLDPVAHAYQECIEELGISKQQLMPLTFLGLISYQHSLETDIVFCMYLSDELVEKIVEQQHWKNAKDTHEHTEFLLLSPQEIFSSNKKLVPSSEFGLKRMLSDIELRGCN